MLGLIYSDNWFCTQEPLEPRTEDRVLHTYRHQAVSQLALDYLPAAMATGIPISFGRLSSIWISVSTEDHGMAPAMGRPLM